MKKNIFVLLIFAVTAVVCSCSFFEETEDVTFNLQAASSENQTLTEKNQWEIFYISEDGSLSSLKSFGGKINLAVPKNMAFAVTCICESTAECYGTIYPYKTNLTAEDFFAADVLLSLTAAAVREKDYKEVQLYLSRFNWQRFMSECSNFPDKSKLDKEKVMTAIASGKFKKTDIKEIF